MCRRYELSRNVRLADLTTLNAGGPAEYFAAPASRPALLELLADCRRAGVPVRVLGRGSNVLVADAGVAGLVVRATEFDKGVEVAGGYVTAGAAVTVQRLITAAGKAGLGGIEYLYSVPGNVGGAVKMNAGRGRAHRQSIGDHVVEVEAFDGVRVRRLSRRGCRFGYRMSVFHTYPDLVVLSARLRLPAADPAEVMRRVKERLEFTRRTQDAGPPNAGTVFKAGFALGDRLKGLRAGGAQFSEKTANWILNPAGTAADVRALIDEAVRRHTAAGMPAPELEWAQW